MNLLPMFKTRDLRDDLKSSNPSTNLQMQSFSSSSVIEFRAVSAPSLARGAKAEETDPAEGSARKAEAGKKIYRILIADDHEALRRGLRSALLGAGWDVCGEAADGKQAIEKTKELKPDLVLLDLSMPVMSGHEAAREILRNNPGVKIVVFTMHESQQVRDALTKIGVHALAVKSAPLSLLLDTIQNVLGS
jgi:CheY-like chemotaxis protein